MTNEERFIGSCNSVGEAEVRARLNADRYSAGKALWAAAWLERIEGAKSDATKAEERRTHLPQARPAVRLKLVYLTALVAAVLLICAVLFVQFS